jgi:Ca-activated chloride channel homolog
MSPTASPVPGVRTGLIVRGTGDPVPLDHVRVDASVADLCARVTVHQSYRNREAVPLEVVYVFPLDEGAAVCGFEATVDGVRYVGQVLQRDEAFRKYDDAMEVGDGAYLLDEERADVFTASLGNVQPGSEVVLSVTYVTELAAEGAAARFTLPTTVSPRYAPTEDQAGVGPTPADVLNPPVALDVPYAFEFEMDLAMNGRVRAVTSPSHPIEVEFDGGRGRIRLARRTAPMDRDLVVVIAVEGLDHPHAVVERGERGGALMVSFVPAFEPGGQPADVVFVIDRSGSMAGESIAEVRNALQLCLRSLAPGCRFNIVSFGDSHSALFRESQPYGDRSMKQAAKLVAALDADMGGTELLPALEFVVRQPAVAGLPRQVLLLTDGEVTNTDAVIDLARSHAAKARFFTFGIGAGASQHLVRGIARASGGAAEFIAPGERIEAKVMRQFKRVLAPALTDVRVDWGQEVTPSNPEVPPVFDGERLIVYALADAPVAGTVRLTGALAGRAVSFDVAVNPSNALAGTTIATLAARARIRTLEEQGGYLESRGSRQKRARAAADPSAEIAALGVKYQLCSRETSFVAVEHREVPATERAELRRVPVALTSGWGGVGRFGMRSTAPVGAPMAAAGADAMWLCRVQHAVYQEQPDEEMCSLADTSRDRFERQFAALEQETGASPRQLRVPRGDREARPAVRGHDRLVALQAADGSWDLTPEFAGLLDLDPDGLAAALALAVGDPALARRGLATALAVAWLEKHCGRDRAEWEMLAAKAVRWLDGCTAAPAGLRRWPDVAAQLLG